MSPISMSMKSYCRTTYYSIVALSARDGHFFSNRVVNVWNSLPDSVILSPTVASFKQTTDNWFRPILRLIGLGPDRYMTISVHTISVHVFRQIRNLDHFGTCTTSVRVSRVPHRYIPLRYIALTSSVQCHISTLNHAFLRDTVGPGNRRRLSDDLLTLSVELRCWSN